VRAGDADRIYATSGIDRGRDAPMLAFDKTYVTAARRSKR
jgi:hypothetical protein